MTMSGGGALDISESDSDDQLPAGWEERVAESGDVYYANHDTEDTQWSHPVSGKHKLVQGRLPYGWERQVDSAGNVTFIDTINGRTTFTDPRLAFAQENRKSKMEHKQKFDGSSTALEVLVGHDLSEKYVVITGATSGIGFETARSLAMHGAHVILACRNLTLGNERRDSIITEQKKAHVEVMHLDLASLTSVRKFAQEYLDKEWPLHILILNAGIMTGHVYTEDDLESVFQVNYLSQYLLTRLLKDAIIANRNSRIVHVSSECHRFAPTLDFNNLTTETLSLPPKKHSMFSAYNISKLCNVLVAKELHRRWGSEYGLLSVSLHPGNMIGTRLQRDAWWLKVCFFLVRPFVKSLQQGAATTVYCAVDTQISDAGGDYFNNCCNCLPSLESNQPELSRALWDRSEQILKEKGFL